MQKTFTLVDPYWCHIFPWEVSTVLPSSLCPSSEMPENVISAKVNSYQSMVQWIPLIAPAREELRVPISPNGAVLQELLHGLPQERTVLYSPCWHYSTKPRGICYKRWIRTGDHTRSWHQRCPHRPHRLFL